MIKPLLKDSSHKRTLKLIGKFEIPTMMIKKKTQSTFVCTQFLSSHTISESQYTQDDFRTFNSLMGNLAKLLDIHTSLDVILSF